MELCNNCGKSLIKRQSKYCSNKCQHEWQYKNFISLWKESKIQPATKNISKYLKRYLLDTLGKKCSQCSWDKINPITEKVMLEVNHIDGNAGNNNEENLQLLCPNCHSLTSNFKNLNRGKGRKWRTETI